MFSTRTAAADAWLPTYFSHILQPSCLQMLQRYAYDNRIDRFTRFNTEVLTVRHQPDGR